MRRGELDPDPLRQFGAWLARASSNGVAAPETMTLATASAAARPSARQVLLKGFDQRGFVFYSHATSRKGRELAENPHAAVLFHWQPLGLQVRIEGTIEPVEHEESERYFRTRPLGSRLGAAVSPQSEVVPSRAELERRVAELRAAVGAEGPPLPRDWGGYRLAPAEYEFWEHREDRLHDRFRYRQHGSDWLIERLAP